MLCYLSANIYIDTICLKYTNIGQYAVLTCQELNSESKLRVWFFFTYSTVHVDYGTTILEEQDDCYGEIGRKSVMSGLEQDR